MRLVLLWLLLAATGFAQVKQPEGYTVAPEPTWAQPPAPGLDTPVPEDQVSDGLYNILADTEIRAASHETYVQNVTRILTDTGVQNGSTIQIEVDPSYEKLQLHKVELYRDGAWHDRLDPRLITVLQQERQMDQFMLDGRYTIVIRLSDVRPGDIIRYSYTLTGENPALANFFATTFNTLTDDPCAHLRERIWMPSGHPLYSKSHQASLAPNVTKTPEGDLYEWNILNAPAVVAETDVPAWEDVYPWVDASDMSGWDVAVKWALPLYDFSLPLPTELQAKVDAIKNEEDPRQRVLLALRVVQDDIRYFGTETGEHSHKPRSPTEVYTQGFGDCKEKVLLLGTMLKQLGIESHAVLVNSTWTKGLKDMTPSIAAFDHVVLQVEVGGRKQIVDPTRAYQRGPLDSLPVDRFGWGLVVREGEHDLTPIDPPPASTDRDLITQTFEVPPPDNSTPGLLHVHSVYRGDSAETQRERFATDSRVALQEKSRQFYAELYPSIEVAQPIRIGDSPKENIFEIWEEYRIPKMWTPTADPKYEGLTFYPTEIVSYLKKPATSGRVHSYELDYPVNVTLETKIKAPIKVEVDPVKFSERNDFFDLKYRTSGGGRNIDISTSYQALSDHVPPAHLAAYRTAAERSISAVGYEMSYPVSGSR